MAIAMKFIIFAAIIAIAATSKFEDGKHKGMEIYSKKGDVGKDMEPETGKNMMSKMKDEDDDDVTKISIKVAMKTALLLLVKLFKLVVKMREGFGGFNEKPMEFNPWGNSKFDGHGIDMFGKPSFDFRDYGLKTALLDKSGVFGAVKDHLKARLLRKI